MANFIIAFVFFLISLSGIDSFLYVPSALMTISQKTAIRQLQRVRLREDVSDKRYRTQLSMAQSSNELIGEDSAKFDLKEQDPIQWIQFTTAVSGVLGFLFYIWIYDNGLHWGDGFKYWMEELAHGDTTLTITYMLLFFAVAHSGLASLRPYGEEIIGARAWRYLFALVSLPLAFSSIVYFINHRYSLLFTIYTVLLLYTVIYNTTIVLLMICIDMMGLNYGIYNKNHGCIILCFPCLFSRFSFSIHRHLIY
jgi:hypothetical protein